MNKLHILVQGYAKPSKKGKSFFASSSSILIQNNHKNILIDPGADKNALLLGLEKINLTIKDIDILFLTHWHPDHCLNIQLFPELDIMDGTTVWKNNGEELFPNGDDIISYILNTDIEVIATPGHKDDHVSLIFTDDELGKICIAQDVFWWEDGAQRSKPTEKELLDLEDPYLINKQELVLSRKKILDSNCKWIIPGHGIMFENPKFVL